MGLRLNTRRGLRFAFATLTTLLATACSPGFQNSKLSLPSLSKSGDAVVFDVKITEPASMAASSSQVQLAGQCGADFNIEISGDVQATSLACADGKFSASLSLLPPDGVKNVVVRQKGAKETSDTRSFVRDTVAPAVEIVNLTEGQWVRTMVALSGTCENGLVVRIAAGSVFQDVTCTAGNFTGTIDIANATDGTITVSAEQVDAAKLSGKKTRSVRKDTVAPALTIAAPANGAAVQSPVALSGACETGRDVNISGSGLSAPQLASCVGGAYSASLVMVTGNGARAISVSQTDAAGNEATVQATYQHSTPAGAIPVTITGPAANSAAKMGVTLTGTCRSGLPVVVSGAGVSASVNATCSALGTFSQAITFSAGDGVKPIVVTQTDANNNRGTDTRSFVRDTVVPTLTIASPAAGTYVSAMITLAGTCETGLGVKIAGSGVATQSMANCTNGAYSAQVALSQGDGSKEVTVEQTDGAGNVATVPRAFLRDTTAPMLTIMSPDAGTSSATGLTVAGSCESGLSVTAQGAGVKAPVSQVCQSSLYSLAITFSDGDGSKVVEIVQTDAAGNLARASRTFTRMSAPVPLDGAQLYTQNCATCHGQLAVSAKIGRTAVQIQAAINTIPAMGGLKSLTSQQVAAIAAALGQGPTTPGMTNPFTCTPGTDPAVAKLKRLTKREYAATLLDLFGSSLAAGDFSAQLALVPAEAAEARPTIQLFDTTNPTSMNLPLLKAYHEVASRIADVVTASATKMNAVAGDACISGATVTDACLTTVFNNFGLRAYRRPLTATERTAYTTLYRTGSSSADSFARVIHAMLQSPPFLYHLHDGGTLVSGKTNVLQFSPYEIATKLSYMILGSMPDAALFTAAGNGSLGSAAGIQTQVDRLMGLPRAKDGVRAFYSQWLRVDHIPQASAGSPYLAGLNPAVFRSEARQEILDFMDHMIWTQKSNFQGLFTSDQAFAKGPQLASVYGVAASATGQRLSDPNRKGLLTRAGMLAMSETGTTDPIKRGVRMRIHLLCDNLGAPPNNADELAPAVDPLSSTRTQFTVKTSPALCTGCHTSINGLGFAFENYDGFGRYRVNETVTSGAQSATHPIDAKTYPNINGPNDPQVNGAVELQAAMIQSNKGPACMSKQWFQYALGRNYETADACSVAPLYDALMKSGGSIQDMFKALSQTPSFQYKKID